MITRDKTVLKSTCELEFAHCFLINFTFAKCKVTFFIKNFLISTIDYGNKRLINLGLLIKNDS